MKSCARALAEAIAAAAPKAEAGVAAGVGFLGSGSLPMEELATFVVTVSLPGVKTEELARRLRMDEACVFTRIENERVVLDARTLTDAQVPLVAAAAARAAQ